MSSTTERITKRTEWSSTTVGIVVGIVTLLVSICAAEIALRFLAPIPDPYETAKTTTVANQYIRSEFPRDYQIRTHAEPGLPGVIGSHLFTTNNMGFRGDYLQRPKPADEFRVFMVGGSTTECLYLDDSESIDRIVQNELNAHVPDNVTVKVFNAGKSGDAIDDHISMIVHRIVHLEPDLIVVFSGVNDLTRSIYNESNPLHYFGATGTKLDLRTLVRFVGTEFQIPRRIHYLIKRIASRTDTQVLEEITLRSNYREKVQLRKSAPVSEIKPSVDLQTYMENLRTIVGVSKGHAVALFFMTQQSTWTSPDPKTKDWQWILYREGVAYQEESMNEALEFLNDAMRQVAASAGIPTYDLARLLPKSSDFFYDDVHFNVNGSREAGKGLARFIKESYPNSFVKAQ